MIHTDVELERPVISKPVYISFMAWISISIGIGFLSMGVLLHMLYGEG